MLLQSVLFVIGLVGLVYGAEWLVAGSANLARRAGISQIVIGLTVVALGTSMPELVVSVLAATSGKTDVAIGNVVGSNIVNISLILGATAMVRAVPVPSSTLMKDVPVMIGAAILVTLFAIDAIIGRVDAIILLAGCTAYLGLLMRDALQPPAVAREEIEVFAPPETPRPTRTRDIVHILGGVVGLVVGGRLLVTSASFFATAIGVSDLVIGLTVVAVGTSLPELATSVLAAFRGHSDLALGNVIGSNILNLLLILGTTALIHPLPAHPSMLTFEIPVMVGISILLVPLALRGSRITRWEGALLVVGYFVFLFVVVYKGQSTL
jgi:cation:H+ antiporter